MLIAVIVITTTMTLENTDRRKFGFSLLPSSGSKYPSAVGLDALVVP